MSSERERDEMNCKPLMTENEVVELLGLKDRPNPQGALRWLMRTGKIGYVKLAKGIYGFRRQAIEAFINRGTVDPAG